jgi:GAF domain-containing protein
VACAWKGPAMGEHPADTAYGSPDFGSVLAEVARGLTGQGDLKHTVQRMVDLAAEHLDGEIVASVSLVRARNQVETPASSDPRAERADALQYELGEGPCLDAIWEHETFQIEDMETEQRYPRWATRVIEETGLRSSLSYQLFIGDNTLGALNLYAVEPHAFDDDDRADGLLFAAHAAAALQAAVSDENLRSALMYRLVIGQAQGILMERHHITAQMAFDLLRRISQRSNVKLREVAQEVVEGRTAEPARGYRSVPGPRTT